MKQKSILAFSGGLDTSVVVKYMQDIHDTDVITVTVDVGQGDNHNKIANKAIIISVLDNLVKGAAGQAIQNLNLMMGFNESEGLANVPMFP